MSRQNWSWLTQAKLQDLVNQHGTLEEVACHLGTTRTCLSQQISNKCMTIQYDQSRRKKKPSHLDQYAPVLEHLSRLGWSVARISKALALPTQYEQVRRWLRDHGMPVLSRGEAHAGEYNVAYVNGLHNERGDYPAMPAPKGYQGQIGSNGWIHIHRYVMEQKLGRYLKPGEVVHHIDENIQNNHQSNLMLFPNAEAHLRHHFEQWRVSYQERLTALLEEDRKYVQSLGW